MITRVDNDDHPLALQELSDRADLTPKVIDEFLASRSFPLVEGNLVTFVFRGPADAVYLHQWIYGMPSAQPFARLKETDLWYLAQEIPEKSRIEYKLEVVEGRTHRLIQDPLNTALARDPFGANSVCHGAGYEIPDWTEPDPEARTGTVEEITIDSKAFGEPRGVSVYLPARYRPDRSYALLIAHDGGDYMKYSGFKTVLDNLIHRLEIPSMIVALTHPRARLREYANDENHAKFLVEELIPHLEKTYPLLKDPSTRGLLGASFGGVASLSTAARYPAAFGRLFLQSGSFAFTDIGPHQRGPAFDPVVEFVNTYRKRPFPLAEKVYLTCGVYESLIYENRSLLPILQSTGMDVRFVESRDGHNWENWRDTFRGGLSWLYPGPLWMVYE